MRQTKWTRIAGFLLALCLVLSLIPAAAFAAEEEQTGETIDFVLVVDCSNTMDENDPDELARDACKMFVDLIPIEDARVSVIAFGYEGSDAYQYHSFEVKKGRDANFVHEISKLEGQLSIEKKEQVKRAIDALGDVDGQLTPIGAALAAGMDVLLNNGATDGNACVILMTDGETTSTELAQNAEFMEQVPGIAKSHDWPVYCIEMDYWDNNEIAGSSARKLLNQIVTESGAGADGRMKVSSPAEVAEAFMKIFASVWGSQSKVIPQVLDENGVVELEFEIPKLASEATIAISSSAVDYVELINEAQGYNRKFDDDVEEKNLIVTVEDSYISLKMICPTAGTWKVRAYGDPNAEIVWYEGIQMEMNLAMVANPSSTAEVLTKNDYINVEAKYTYNGNEVGNDDIYETTVDAAQLVVSNANGTTRQFDMEATKDGYTLKLPVSEVPSGQFTVQVLVEHTMFRSGRVVSNVSQTFASQNLPLEHNESAQVDRTGYVNSQFERIDLAQVFTNPDGDPITYTLSCTSDKSAVFEYTLEEDTDYLTIATGMVPGVYEMEITAADPDMNEPISHTFTLTVEDRAIEQTPIEEQELWVDYFEFLFIRQEPTNLTLDIDLNNYFTDPDGVELVYSNVNGDETFVQVERSGSVLHLVPVGEGETTVTVDVSDGVSTITAQIPVEVVSGVAVYWKENWIYWAICGAVILAVIFFFLFKHKATSVKGKWSIRLKQREVTVSVDGAVDFATLPASKKAKKKGKNAFRLKDAINDCRIFFDDERTASDWLDDYSSVKGYDQIELNGVFLGTGFVIQKLPGTEDVKVEIGGHTISGKNGKSRVKAEGVRIGLSRVNELNITETLDIFIEPYVEGSSDYDY